MFSDVIRRALGRKNENAGTDPELGPWYSCTNLVLHMTLSNIKFRQASSWKRYSTMKNTTRIGIVLSISLAFFLTEITGKFSLLILVVGLTPVHPSRIQDEELGPHCRCRPCPPLVPS